MGSGLGLGLAQGPHLGINREVIDETGGTGLVQDGGEGPRGEGGRDGAKPPRLSIVTRREMVGYPREEAWWG